MVNFQFNGKTESVDEGSSLIAFLKLRRIALEHLVVEWNGDVLTGGSLPESRVLQSGDTVNVFSMVGGG